MRPTPGDLAYCVVPDGYKRTFHMRFCTIRAAGLDDLSPGIQPSEFTQEALFCEWCTPVPFGNVMVRGCWMLASWLRKVSGPGTDVEHNAGETLVVSGAPELETL